MNIHNLTGTVCKVTFQTPDGSEFVLPHACIKEIRLTHGRFDQFPDNGFQVARRMEMEGTIDFVAEPSMVVFDGPPEPNKPRRSRLISLED